MGRYEVRENGFGGVAENFGMRSLELTRKWFEGNIIQKIQKLWESGFWYIIGNVAGRSLVGVCGKLFGVGRGTWWGLGYVVGRIVGPCEAVGICRESFLKCVVKNVMEWCEAMKSCSAV